MLSGYRRSTHVRCNKWRDMKRVFSDGTTQKRYIREIIFGKRRLTTIFVLYLGNCH
jgi:hypothetical protein